MLTGELCSTYHCVDNQDWWSSSGQVGKESGFLSSMKSWSMLARLLNSAEGKFRLLSTLVIC